MSDTPQVRKAKADLAGTLQDCIPNAGYIVEDIAALIDAKLASAAPSPPPVEPTAEFLRDAMRLLLDADSSASGVKDKDTCDALRDYGFALHQVIRAIRQEPPPAVAIIDGEEPVEPTAERKGCGTCGSPCVRCGSFGGVSLHIYDGECYCEKCEREGWSRRSAGNPPERKGQPEPLPDVLPVGTRIACEDVIARKPVRLIEAHGEMVYFGDWGIRDGEHAPEGFWRPGDIDWDHWRSPPAAQTQEISNEREGPASKATAEAASVSVPGQHQAGAGLPGAHVAVQGKPVVPTEVEPSGAGKGEAGEKLDGIHAALCGYLGHARESLVGHETMEFLGEAFEAGKAAAIRDTPGRIARELAEHQERTGKCLHCGEPIARDLRRGRGKR